MIFSSLLFLFIFLPIVILMYYLVPRKLKNLILFVASLIFYAWGEPVYIGIMLFSSIVDYIHGLLIDRYRYSTNFTRFVLMSSIVINIGLLCFFKYYDFIVYNLNPILGTSIEVLDLPLPIGISFYTFQTLSYTIDVYRGKIGAQKNIISFGTYVALFPQLVAGPIVRYETIEKELNHRVESFDSFGAGVRRFILGLGKKVLLANNIGILWSEIKDMPYSELTVLTAWLGIIAYSFQIYFDFSGYSDMAIGLGKIFGFNFPENFNYPYISKSITEFWRRWHISLGSWFREYVYIPLGGNKGGSIKFYKNLFIVWFLTGLWHGPSWNFVLWGIYFGTIIAIEKSILSTWLEKSPKSIAHLYTIVLIIFGWVLFYFDNLSQGIEFLKIMLGFSHTYFISAHSLYYLYNYLILLIILCISSTPVVARLSRELIKKNRRLYFTLSIIFYVGVLVLSTAYLVDDTYNPFLYFRF